MDLLGSLLLALAGGLLLLGGVEHLRRPEDSATVLTRQSRSGLLLARLVRGHVGLVGSTFTVIGVVGVLVAAIPDPPSGVVLVGAGLVAGTGGVLLLHAAQVLRHGDLPCGCMGAHDEPMTHRNLLPSTAVVVGAGVELALAAGSGGTAPGTVETACAVVLGVQAAVVLSLVTVIGAGPTTTSTDPRSPLWPSS